MYNKTNTKLLDIHNLRNYMHKRLKKQNYLVYKYKKIMNVKLDNLYMNKYNKIIKKKHKG